MREVWAAQWASSWNGPGAMVISMAWCSAAQAMSKPPSSAIWTISVVWRATSRMSWSGE